MTAVELVVTDLDGTLWDVPDTLHPATTAAIAELERRGTPLLVATGRRLASTREPLLRFGLTPPVVVLNGALVVDLATGERIHRHAFSTDDAGAVLQAFLGAGIEPCVYVEHDEVDAFVGSSPSTHPTHLASFGEWVRVADLGEVVANHPILAFGVIGVVDVPVEPLAEALRPIANPHVSRERQYDGGTTITVAPPELSKWDGVAAFCRHRGLDASRVLAIGDGPNDLELLEGALIAVAPTDSHPEALARADHVVPPASRGGWAELLELLDY